MKKLLVLALAIIMMVSLIACGGANDDTMVIGYTIYEPMNFKADDGTLTGFDTELAEAVCAKLGVTPEFVVIDWDNKFLELESESIDCIWNGMTITEERKANMAVTIPYMNNKQVAIIRKEDKDAYKTTEDMKKALLGAEDGSAGMDCCVVVEAAE